MLFQLICFNRLVRSYCPLVTYGSTKSWGSYAKRWEHRIEYFSKRMIFVFLFYSLFFRLFISKCSKGYFCSASLFFTLFAQVKRCESEVSTYLFAVNSHLACLSLENTRSKKRRSSNRRTKLTFTRVGVLFCYFTLQDVPRKKLV